jgi:hypothetical protein
VIREGFLIGGWVAMWRPLEVFLYDWWPNRQSQLLRRAQRIHGHVVRGRVRSEVQEGTMAGLRKTKQLLEARQWSRLWGSPS